jgi:outer membrane protein assembly factor BamE (lipoprotein component of BamABCDE complex)
MRKGMVVLAALMLAGCVSSGTKVDTTQIASFQKGKTTYAQVVQALGPPISVSTLSDGTRIIGYGYVHAEPRAASFIPVVGLFAGGADAQSQSVIFTFGPDGTLRDYSTTTSKVGSSMLGGTKAE